MTTIISHKKHKRHKKHKHGISIRSYVPFCGNKFAGDAVPVIVIASKRNGAYADNIQVQQLGSRRVV